MKAKVPRLAGRPLAVVALLAVGVLGPVRDGMTVPIKLEWAPEFIGRFEDVKSIPRCATYGKFYRNCTSTAYLGTTSLSGITARLRDGFNAWNKTNPDDAKWTLQSAGLLPDSETAGLLVTTFRAAAEPTVGGVDVHIDWLYEGTDPPLRNFEWVQALTANYRWRPDERAEPYTTLDVLATGCDNNDPEKQCPPFYPISNGSRAFEDTARGPWPNAFFSAEAFLAQSDVASRILKVYEGVSWGYALRAVPEPGSLFLLILAGIYLGRMRRR